MTNNLIQQSIAELQDIVSCRCHAAYTSRGLHDPECHCDSAEAVTIVADHIRKLEDRLAASFAALNIICRLGVQDESLDVARAALSELQRD